MWVDFLRRESCRHRRRRTRGGSQQVAAAGVDVLPGTLITSLDFTDNGSSVGALNDIAGSLAPMSRTGPDVFYTFTVITGGP